MDNENFSFYILADGTLMCTASSLQSKYVTFDDQVKIGGYSLGSVITAINNLPSDEKAAFTYEFFGYPMDEGLNLYEWPEKNSGVTLYSAGDGMAVGIQYKETDGEWANSNGGLPAEPPPIYTRYWTGDLNCIIIKFISVPLELTTITELTFYVKNPNDVQNGCRLWVRYGPGDEDILYDGEVYFQTDSVYVMLDQPFTIQDGSIIAIYFTRASQSYSAEWVYLTDTITFTGTK